MKNSYEKNMEAMLQKAFLAQDFEAPKNQKLLDFTAQSSLKGGSSFFFFIKSGLFKTLLFMSAVVLLLFVGDHLTADELANYTPTNWGYELPQEEKVELNEIPVLEATVLSKENKRPEIHQITPLVYELKELKDSIKRYTPEKEEIKFPKLSEDEIEKNIKLKGHLIKEVLKFAKNRVVKVNVFDQNLRKGEEELTDFVIWTGELSNLEYGIFLNDLLVQKKKEDYLLAKVYDKGWEEFSNKAYLMPMTNMYSWHPAFHEYPVVNISRKGAELFCEWLEQEIQKSNKNKNGLWEVRIPTNREWEYAASSGIGQNIYPWAGPHVRNDEGCFLANFKAIKNPDSLFNLSESSCGGNAGGILTHGTHSYNPNKVGIYNIAGNVSEMVYYPYQLNEIGARGGNWNSIREEIKIYGKDSYLGVEKASPLVGFRPVITYQKKRINGRLVFDEVIAKPILTKKEQEDNDKRKLKLLKEIIKVDHDVYTNGIRGKMRINGTEELTVLFFASKLEVTNIQYKTFLFDLIGQGRYTEYEKAKPDFKVWAELALSEKIFPKEYLMHLSYQDYPVVNIS
ncbi:MAG: SUMF1/EgtB/PvdO family nonheme iron enzyme, partial [Flavobacteriales bacterium]|nr:SUMF1/EgtB/PvdO family nonheme iron enzyme [Flavobacteriales bacterium]